MENIIRLKYAISKLDEREAKALLTLVFTRIAQCREEEVTQILQSIKTSLLEDSQHDAMNATTVHIVFSDSPAGSLRAAFRDTAYANTEEIIVLPDLLAIGPIEALQTQEGIDNRYRWLKENICDEFNYFIELKQRFIQAIEKIKAIPAHQQIIIWTCENAAEQTSMRFVLYLLQDKVNEVFELNTYKVFHELYTYPILEGEVFPLSSGEVNAEQLLQFYEQFELRAMNIAKRQDLVKEGRNLLLSKAYLRTWANGEIRHANIDRDDDFIIECARRMHEEIGTHDFMKAARLIGEVLGHMQQYTGDEWIEYRLRHLVASGVFEFQGDLSAMRLYEVKLKETLLQ